LSVPHPTTIAQNHFLQKNIKKSLKNPPVSIHQTETPNFYTKKFLIADLQ
jgi:hypothetical protein